MNKWLPIRKHQLKKIVLDDRILSMIEANKCHTQSILEQSHNSVCLLYTA